MTRFVLALSLFASLSACSKKEGTGDKAGKASEASGAAPAKADPPAPTGNFPAEFAAWDMGARTAAWQGAWSGEAMSLGQKGAWEITGSKLHYLDKTGDKQMEFQVTSPCTAKFIEKSASGSSSTESVYTLQNGQLITGLGSAGQKKGDQAVVCGGGSIFTLDAKGCTEWEDDFGKLKSKPGECSFAKDGDKGVFKYKAHGMETVLLVDGDVIWSEQLKNAHAAKQASFDAARQAQGL